MARLIVALMLTLWAGISSAAGTVAVLPVSALWGAYGPGGADCPTRATLLLSAMACQGQFSAFYDSVVPSVGYSCNWMQRAYVDVSTGAPRLWLQNTPSSIPGNSPCMKVTTNEYTPIQGRVVYATSCPGNSTGLPASNPASCTCDGGYKPNGDAKQCVADCTADAEVSSGWYDIGESQGASPQLLGCKGLCEVVFDGTSPAGSAMVQGKKHWYAKGAYIATGGSCPAAMADKPIGTGTPTKPEDTCAPGEAQGTVNGKAVCVKQSGEDAGKPTDDSANKGSKSTEKSTVTNPDGSTTTTEVTTEIDSKGNKTVTTTKTTNRPDGSSSSTTNITNNGKSTAGGKPGTGEAGEGEDEDEDDEETECQKNPSGEGCGGKPATVGTLYTAKTKTMAGVLGAHRDAVMGSAFGGAVGGFFSVSGGGSCPTWNAHIPFLDADLSIDQFCSAFARDALAILKIAILLGASFFAFRVAVE